MEGKIGIIGLGACGRTHYAMLKEHAGRPANILCDVTPMDNLEAEYKTNDWQEAIDKSDIVMIATPTNMHYVMVMKAVSQGKPVFCQKPLARTLDEAKDILNAVRENNIPFQVGYIMRYSGVINKIKGMMDSIGSGIFWREMWHIAGQAYPPWLFNSDGGGPIFENSHRLEFLISKLGAPLVAYAKIKNFTSKFQDTFGIIVEFERGTAFWSDSWAREGSGVSNREPRVMFDAIGPEGHIVHPVRVNETVLYDVNGNEKDVVAWDHLGISGYDEEMRSFLRYLDNGTLEGCSVVEATQVIALIDAILKSSESGVVEKVEKIE